MIMKERGANPLKHCHGFAGGSKQNGWSVHEEGCALSSHHRQIKNKYIKNDNLLQDLKYPITYKIHVIET